MTKTNTFIISWDMYGMEMCKDITSLIEEAQVIDAENIFELIKDPKKTPPNEPLRKISRYVTMSTLRARFNPQRNYEVYVLNASPEITEDVIENAFNENPQDIVDLIRKRGKALFNGRNNLKQVIV